uniref:Carbohydrate kinase PfkB domain-containing protein n=1 Tax=Chlamydomonas euryale TaxID=1486919 RepID=A0A7R9YT32_9CHLO
MGGAVVDYLATVAAYPTPDQKLRSESLEVQGGGNCGNALTAASRLGLSPVLVTKIGADGVGDTILRELESDGIDTSCVLRAEGSPSPFTYIIVDRDGGTRTCIHTPGAPLDPEEMRQSLAGGPSILDSVLADAALVYFDGRLTEAALLLARRARQVGVPVLVEAERLRPNLEELLTLADYVVTSAHFPQEWTGASNFADAVLSTAQRLPNAKCVISTMGTRGSLMLCREGSSTSDNTCSIVDVVRQLEVELEKQTANTKQASFDCVSRTGVEIRAGYVTQSPGALPLTFSDSYDAEAARISAEAAASREATFNADASNATGYQSTATKQPSLLSARVLRASAAALPKSAVVDTTGAGDSFIGSVLYGLATGMPYPEMLRLAAVVAACKCTEVGARAALPQRSNLAAHLL